MGEYADLALEEMWDVERDWEGNEYDGFDYVDLPYGDCGPAFRPINYKTCRCCGERMLQWGNVDGKWRLFTTDGQLHRCPVNPLKE
jgi:hypothetical protein